MILLLLTLQVPPALPALRTPGDLDPSRWQTDTLCPGARGTSRSELLVREARTADEAQRGHRPTVLAQLGCERAVLYAAGAMGREGYLMPSGASWLEGAVAALRASLDLNLRNSAAGDLYGILVVANNTLEHNDVRFAAIRNAIAGGNLSRGLLRACSELAARTDDAPTAISCAQLGLSRGADSTWHLMRLAQVAAHRADTLATMRYFGDALDAAHDPDAWSEIQWHLQWFLAPAELSDLNAVPHVGVRDWVRDRLMERDVRDGQPVGARLVEHFGRLAYVLDHFTLRLPAVMASNPRGIQLVTPENTVPPEAIGAYCEPGVVPAIPVRDYNRWQNRIDDRGVVWLRLGPPTKRIRATPQCVERNRNMRTGVEHVNTREAWRYDIDGRTLLLQFEVERFTGSVEPTRLVTGVLGSYLCGVDTTRCNLTTRSISSYRAGHRGADADVHPEEISELIGLDAQAIAEATTIDDNSPRGAATIGLAAGLHRLWNPVSSEPIAVLAYSIPARDLAQDAPVALTIRQWDPQLGKLFDSTFVERGVASASAPRIERAFLLPTPPALSAWSLTAVQPGRRGRAFSAGVRPLGRGPVEVSDIVIGVSGGVSVRIGSNDVPVSPTGFFDRTVPMALYYQVRLTGADEDLRTSIQVQRVEQAQPGDTKLQVSFDGVARAGINERDQQVDITRLQPGIYEVELALTNVSGRVVARKTLTVSIR